MCDNPQNERPGQVALAVVLAVCIVIMVSLLPVSELSNGIAEDFNIFSDIVYLKADTADTDSNSDVSPAVTIDPELQKAMDEVLPSDQWRSAEQVDVAERHSSDTESELEPVAELPVIKPNREGDAVLIEDYTVNGRGLENLRRAIASGSARIAVAGDSYIEGDIFTQDLRRLLQSTYGGSGVGYVNMYSEFPGFRRTVRQSGKGWTEKSAAKNGKNIYLMLAERYFMVSDGSVGAEATYKGTKSLPHLESWDRSRFIFIAPKPTTVRLKTSGEWQEYQVDGSEAVQCLEIDEPTGQFSVRLYEPSAVAFGVWLESSGGISVDCMSSRGYSGITLARIDTELCREIGKFVPYDLVILEFGINAMSAGQKNYSVYSKKMAEVIEHVRSCFPTADILLMGVGDRGQKRGGEVHTMSTVPYMIAAQRDAARRARCLFWDTQDAMGGDDAIVSWSREGKANKDYIHLTHKGGASLAELFFNALQKSIDE